jgi:hypothetical protein
VSLLSRRIRKGPCTGLGLNSSSPLRLLCFVWAPVCAASSPSAAAPPYPNSSAITAIRFNWSTHVRLAPGSDNWPVTWADDDHQYTAWGDGGGFGGTNSDGRVSLGFARIEGPRNNYTGFNVWGGKAPENPATFPGKCYGMLCVDCVLYAVVNDQETHTDRIYKSVNHGATWSGAPWTIPAEDRTASFLQFGRDYAGSRDRYVYVYAPMASWKTPGTGVWLARVPKAEIMTWNSWVFYGGLSKERPVWTSWRQRRAAFQDTRVAWAVSVSYDAGIGRYLLCSTHKSPMTESGLGIFDAPEPWGPWTTVAYYDDWRVPAGQGSTFFYSFSNKWMRPDGLDFVMVWTGTGDHDAWNTVEGRFTAAPLSRPATATRPGPRRSPGQADRAPSRTAR